jgi:hypothetical protein
LNYLTYYFIFFTIQDKSINNWKKLPEANVSELWDILGKIDRFDVRDDVGQKIKEDVRVAAETAAKKGLDLKNLTAAESASGEEA